MGIRLENVDYVYAAGTAEEKKALDDINLKINDGEFIGLVEEIAASHRISLACRSYGFGQIDFDTAFKWS